MSLVTVVRRSRVPTFSSVTVAPGSTAPLVSVTRPTMSAVVCANDAVGNAKPLKNRRAARSESTRGRCMAELPSSKPVSRNGTPRLERRADGVAAY